MYLKYHTFHCVYFELMSSKDLKYILKTALKVIEYKKTLFSQKMRFMQL